MRCRKNFVDLTADERNWLADGLNALYANGTIGAYADEHNADFENGIHHGPAFLPWHRHFLYRFEQLLRSVEARATLPYWDWTRPDSQSLDIEPWKSFFGGRSNSGGRFDHWALTRDAAPAPGEVLPTLDAVIDELGAGTFAGFRAIEFLSHVPGHTWTGGTMAGGRSPADPLFYLHHGNVDRLWAIWQRNHPGAEQYNLDDCAVCERIDATFVPLNTPMLGGATPASMLDRGPLGYYFPTDSRLEDRVAARGLPAMVSGDPPKATLETPVVIFNAVPEGDTTRRAATFLVTGCEGVAFEVTGPPAAPFSLLTGGPFQWPAGPLHTDELRVWVLFTGQTPGSTAAGSMTIIAKDAFGTEIDHWDNIAIMADSVARPRVAVSLVLDESGSMLYDAGNNRRRLDVLKLAARTFVDQLYDDNGLAMVSFADHADVILSLDVAGDPASGHRGDARQAINDHGPADVYAHTSIGAGLQKSAELYQTSPTAANFDIRASVVFTDGFEDRAPLISDVRALINERVYAIGVADAANVRNDILRAIANDTGGFMLVTGAISQDDEFLLDKYFIQVLAGVTNRQIVRDPEGWVVPGQIARVPFSIVRSDIAFDAVALARPSSYLAIGLQAPNGQIITTADLGPAGHVAGPTAQSLRVTLPVVIDGVEHWEGEWQLLLALAMRGQAMEVALSSNFGYGSSALRFHGIVHARSNLQMRATASQSGPTPGSTIHLRAVLTEYGAALETHPGVQLRIRYPDGSLGDLGMVEHAPGEFDAQLVGSQEGVYRFLVSAAGLSFRGSAFTREQLLTVVIGQPPPPGERPGSTGDTPTRDTICELLSCLTGAGFLSPSVEGRLKESGVDLGYLRRCLGELCRPEPKPRLDQPRASE